LKVEVVDYEPSHVDEIMTKSPRSRELRFCRMAEWGYWKEVWRVPGSAFTLMVDGDPIGSAGIVPMGNGLGEAWAILSNVSERFKKLVFISVRNGMERIIKSSGVKEIQAFVEPDFEEAKHFLYHLGFVEKDSKYMDHIDMTMIKFWRKC